MKLSITKIAERIGAKRREIADIHAKQQDVYASIEAHDDTVQKIQAKYTDGKEPSAEDAASMKTAIEAAAEARKQFVAMNAAAAEAEVELGKLQDEKAQIDAANEREGRLSGSTGRAVGNDGASLVGAEGTSGNIRVLAPTNEQLDHDIATIMRCISLTKGDSSRIADVAMNTFNNDRVAAAMQANTLTAGGTLVPDVYMNRLIDGLFANSVIDRMGIASIPIEFGSLEMPSVTSGATASYVGEGQDADETSVGTGSVKLIPKQLIGLLPMSNTLLVQSSPGADQVMMRQLNIGVGLAQDRNMLRGPKSGAAPTGLRYQAASANVFAANATVNLANVDQDLGLLELALEGSNVPMISPYWVMAPRSKNYLTNLRDGNGNKAYPELSQGMLRGKPVLTTTTIPVNLSTNKSEVYLIESTQQLIGANPRLMIDMSNSASYVNAAGATVNAFQRNETLLRIVMWNDIATMHAESIAVLTDVAWGA